MHVAGIDEKRMQRGMFKPLALTVCMSFIMATVLAHISFLVNHFFHDSFFVDAVYTAFALWLGFAATTLVTHYSFEQRPATLVWLNIGNRFMTIIAMGMIIGWLHP